MWPSLLCHKGAGSAFGVLLVVAVIATSEGCSLRVILLCMVSKLRLTSVSSYRKESPKWMTDDSANDTKTGLVPLSSVCAAR